MDQLEAKKGQKRAYSSVFENPDGVLVGWEAGGEPILEICSHFPRIFMAHLFKVKHGLKVTNISKNVHFDLDFFKVTYNS